jgi:hypothetical protein
LRKYALLGLLKNHEAHFGEQISLVTCSHATLMNVMKWYEEHEASEKAASMKGDTIKQRSNIQETIENSENQFFMRAMILCCNKGKQGSHILNWTNWNERSLVVTVNMHG